MYVQLTIIRSVRSTKIVVRNLREGNTWYEGKRKKQSVTLGFLRKFLLEFKEDKTKICLLYQGYNLWIVYVQRLKRHNEDFVENAFQSKFKLRSQLKKMVERKMEKFLETKRILEISLRPIKKNILHVAYVKRQVTQRRIVCIVQNHNVTIVKILDMWRRIDNKNKHQANFIKEHDSDIFTMLPEILVMRQEEIGT